MDETFEPDLSFADLRPRHRVSSATQTANFYESHISNEFSKWIVHIVSDSSCIVVSHPIAHWGWKLLVTLCMWETREPYDLGNTLVNSGFRGIFWWDYLLHPEQFFFGLCQDAAVLGSLLMQREFFFSSHLLHSKSEMPNGKQTRLERKECLSVCSKDMAENWECQTFMKIMIKIFWS